MTDSENSPTDVQANGTRIATCLLVPTARFVVSIVGAAIVCLLVWRHLPSSLSVRTSVIGYPTFADLDANKYYDAFYLIAVVFPGVAILLYWVVGLPFPRRRLTCRDAVFPLPIREVSTLDASDHRQIGLLNPISALPRCGRRSQHRTLATYRSYQ